MSAGCCSLDGPRKICCITVDPRGRTWVKRLLLGWLIFAIANKILAVCLLGTLSYSGLWRKFTTVFTPQTEPLYLSCAFEVSGLGNLMFQYASLYGLSRQLGRTAVIPDKLRINSDFRLQAQLSNQTRPGATWMQFPELKSSAYDENMVKHLAKADKNAEIVGFFQSWVYFKSYQHEIRDQFVFQDSIQQEVESVLQDVASMSSGRWNTHHRPTLVGIHIRRGDMATERFSRYGYTTASAEYLQRAMDHIEAKYSNVIYILCTDDPDWSQHNVNTANRILYLSQGHSDVVDLGLLAHCDHVIITVGTYGWWAGFLAGGDVTYFKDFPAPGSSLQRAFSRDKQDYFPPHWIGL